MTISPVELHHIRFRRGLFGYRRQPVDRLIEEIAESFEEVWRQRADFADRIEQLESELSRHRDLETLLRTTLVSAEKLGARAQGSRQARGDARDRRGARRGPRRDPGGRRRARAPARRCAKDAGLARGWRSTRWRMPRPDAEAA